MGIGECVGGGFGEPRAMIMSERGYFDLFTCTTGYVTIYIGFLRFIYARMMN